MQKHVEKTGIRGLPPSLPPAVKPGSAGHKNEAGEKFYMLYIPVQGQFNHKKIAPAYSMFNFFSLLLCFAALTLLFLLKTSHFNTLVLLAGYRREIMLAKHRVAKTL